LKQLGFVDKLRPKQINKIVSRSKAAAACLRKRNSECDAAARRERRRKAYLRRGDARRDELSRDEESDDSLGAEDVDRLSPQLSSQLSPQLSSQLPSQLSSNAVRSEPLLNTFLAGIFEVENHGLMVLNCFTIPSFHSKVM
jgi:hypothetical protein